MLRRIFIKNVSKTTAGIAALRLTTTANFFSAVADPAENLPDFAGDHLEAGFLRPPLSARPQTWWHWREGPISKEGITAELEAMKRIGIGGVTMFSSAPMGEKGTKVPVFSADWHERVRFAMQESDRLGLTFNFQNCAGWSGSGGPWITPDKAMQEVVFTKDTVTGGATFRQDAPVSWPQSGKHFYRDIAVLAFPTPAACIETMKMPSPRVTSNFMNLTSGKWNILDSRNIEAVKGEPLTVEAGKSVWVQFEFPVPVTCRSVTIAGTPTNRFPDDHRATVLASNDGNEFREIVRLSTFIAVHHGVELPVTHAIPQTTTRFIRLSWHGPVKLALRQVIWSSQPAIYSYESKIGEFGRTMLEEPLWPFENDTSVPTLQVQDLTSQLDPGGNLTWTAPGDGSWTVLRIGYRNKDRVNMPAPPEATGLECDKFSREVVAFHFDHYARVMIKNARAVNAKNVVGITFDSWEATSQNWSPVFRREFRKRRGYDVLMYLPSFAGYIVGNREITDRFLRDVRQTMSDLVSEVFFGEMRELAHKNGLQVYAESCGGSGAGTMVADGIQHYLQVDVPMNELNWPLKEAVSAAHLTGKSIVALEAFTQGRVDWQSCPASLKSISDSALCAGITRIVFHTYAHNPDINKLYPGPAFGPYGLAFSRGQTWWEMSRGWMDYLSRTQFLLQRGTAIVDVLYFYGEEPGGPIPHVIGTNSQNLDEWPELPKGYHFDLLPADILIKDLSIKEGKLTTSKGSSYRLLVLRNSEKMTPEAVDKIKTLVHAGAIVLGPRPTRSPGLTNYPHCDALVNKISREVWGNCDGKIIFNYAYGRGQVFWGKTVTEVLASISLEPDFSEDGVIANTDVRFIHRQEGATDIYFISNNNSGTVNTMAKFRVTGKEPELWDPVTGKKTYPVSFQQLNGNTLLPILLDSFSSVFVLFRKTVSAGKIKQNRNRFRELGDRVILEGPWEVKFTPGWGAPESVVFSTLEDWSKRGENGIKYYSGTAIYNISFAWDKSIHNPVILGLGRVAVIAGVMLNGKECGIAWTPPYELEITHALRPGKNDLQIRVANTWYNRLMGDGFGINMGSQLHTWTTINPFTTDAKFTVPEISRRVLSYYKDLKQEPATSGLLGPVSLFTFIN